MEVVVAFDHMAIDAAEILPAGQDKLFGGAVEVVAGPAVCRDPPDAVARDLGPDAGVPDGIADVLERVLVEGVVFLLAIFLLHAGLGAVPYSNVDQARVARALLTDADAMVVEGDISRLAGGL